MFSAKIMSCMSDVDLATLHRNRLEERVHYKLSWWARRLINDRQKQLKNNRNSHIMNHGCIVNDCHSRAAGNNETTSRRLRPGCNAERTTALRSEETDERLIENCFADDDYFTMQRRRRSGTWP